MSSPHLFSANTFLIGAQKSGTTYLASLLAQSPDVCVSNPKEPQFYTIRFAQGPEFYQSCFANPSARILLDASTTYTFLRPRGRMEIKDAPGLLDPVPQRIMDVCPEAKFIYIMRDPVKRAASAYRHHARDKKQPDAPLSLIECIERDPMLKLIGTYSAQIERFFEVFPPDRFLFLNFDDLRSDPAGTVTQVCEFLDLSGTAFSFEADKTEQHKAHHLTGAGRVLRRLSKAAPGLMSAMKSALPDGLKKQVVAKVATSPSNITFHDEAAAAALFADDRDRVFDLTGVRL